MFRHNKTILYFKKLQQFYKKTKIFLHNNLIFVGISTVNLIQNKICLDFDVFS